MVTPLLTALANVPDSRKSQGKRHPLSAVLALAIVAVLSGAQSLTAISEWGREQSAELLRQLGFTHWPGPCIATLHRIFRDLDVAALETVLTDWWRRESDGLRFSLPYFPVKNPPESGLQQRIPIF